MAEILKGINLIKNFISPQEVEELLTLCFKVYQPDKDAPQSGRRILLKTKDFRFDLADRIANAKDESKIMIKAKQTLSSIGNDVVSLALRKRLSYLADADTVEDYINSYSPWIRYMKYDKGTSSQFKVHADPPLNPSAIIYLSKCGIDYSGSLYLANRKTLDSPIAIDTYTNPGDLILFNANEYVHWVDVSDYFCSYSNSKKKKSIGRITLFMALNSKAKGQSGTPYKKSLFNFYAVYSIPEAFKFYLQSIKAKAKTLIKKFLN